jgi:exopolyphosphatase/pppGpp-phosphohydrolase
MVAAQRGEQPRSLNAVSVTRAELESVVASVTGARTTAEREDLPGLEPRRADIVLAGVILLEQLVTELEIEELTFSEYALREGVLLEAAALLRNVGLFFSRSAHHRHSYYLIRNFEHLTGFSDREIELIALVARYHRKSALKGKHPEFAELPADEKHLVRVMAGLLRIAIALDRTSSGAVESMDVRTAEGRMTVCVRLAPGADSALELYTAEQRKDLLEDSLGVEIEFLRDASRAAA